MHIDTRSTTHAFDRLQSAVGCTKVVKYVAFPNDWSIKLIESHTGEDQTPVYHTRVYRLNKLMNNDGGITFSTAQDALIHGVCFAQRCKTIEDLFDRNVAIPSDMVPRCLDD